MVKKKVVPQRILEVLEEEDGLTAAEIVRRLAQKGYNHQYPVVHTALKSLTNDYFVAKVSDLYFLVEESDTAASIRNEFELTLADLEELPKDRRALYLTDLLTVIRGLRRKINREIELQTIRGRRMSDEQETI